ncbi:hypothetical protein M5689_010777 [Euphorbia peplus]|nr:hypothetical protein M5689_010777 [Euphorbia peplus]
MFSYSFIISRGFPSSPAMLTILGPLILSGDNLERERLSTPFSSLAFTESKSTLSGSLNCLQNFPTSIFKSSLFKPGTSSMMVCPSCVSFQSTLAGESATLSSFSSPNGICSNMRNGSGKRSDQRSESRLPGRSTTGKRVAFEE